MKSLKLLRFLLPGLLLATLGCSKDDDKVPSKAGQLSAVTWRQSSSSLVVNGVEGTQPTPAADADTYKFSTDGKLVVTKPNGTATNGTWTLAANDTQLNVTLGSQTQAQTQELFTLTETNLSFGARYTQAQVQGSLAGQPVPGLPTGLITLLLLSADDYTFPANTPLPNASQITSLQTRINLVPR